MIPSHYYLEQIKSTHKQSDAKQLEVMEHFDTLFDQLTQKQNLLSKIKGRFERKNIKGIYLWGAVGRGKTFLVDCFYHCLPNSITLRMHFHSFMRRVHQELTSMQGTTNPLNAIAKKFRQEFKVLCLDEFIVSDIGDAMILAELLQALFHENIVLVTTSNTVPDQLYRNGLQRERFLPAIELLKNETLVLSLNTDRDYRLSHLSQASVYYTPLNGESENKMELIFNKISHHEAISSDNLNILGRSIPIHKRAHNVVWFDFTSLCGMQRSQNDYLVISQEFRIVLISKIPVIKAHQRDLITNFIKLVDVLYDAQIKVIISAETNPVALYPEGPQLAEYQRTASRLIEMQSDDYFKKPIFLTSL